MKAMSNRLAARSALLFAIASVYASNAAAQVISADQLIELYSPPAAEQSQPATRGVRGIAGVRTGGEVRQQAGAAQQPTVPQASAAQQAQATVPQPVTNSAAAQGKSTTVPTPVSESEALAEAPALAQQRQAFHNIEFKSGSATISASSYPQLDEIGAALAVVMSRDPARRFVVEGHTDSIGGLQQNDELSRNRAQAIRRFLVVRHGLDGTRIDVVGHGARHPVASNASEQGRRLNRRVEIVSRS